jgi:Fe-S-cluster containining protein
MRCDKGCGDCCGVVPITRNERDEIARYIRARSVSAMPRGAGCPYFQGGQCAIYEVRPRICRAFGHTWKMECPRGYNENVDDAELRRWLLAELPVTTLHALAHLPVPESAFRQAAALPFAWQKVPGS